jgi:hypothetical protein
MTKFKNKYEKAEHYRILLMEKQDELRNFLALYPPNKMVEGSKVHKTFIEKLEEIKILMDKDYDALQELPKIQIIPSGEELKIQ